MTRIKISSSTLLDALCVSRPQSAATPRAWLTASNVNGLAIRSKLDRHQRIAPA
jgi:hypothetical protein